MLKWRHAPIVALLGRAHAVWAYWEHQAVLAHLSVRWRHWRARIHAKVLHRESIEAYKSGNYPLNPSIGLGQAFQDGLLDTTVLCNHSWPIDALYEGPVFLQAWRKASMDLKNRGKRRYSPYSPKEALNAMMGSFKEDWALGWGPQFEGDTRSPCMRVVQWVHDKDPQWIGNNLNAILFTSSLSLWDSLLYRDVDTSRWAMAQWPAHLKNQSFPWNDWTQGVGWWTYPMINYAVQSMNPATCKALVAHLAQWSPLRDASPQEQLRGAIAMMGAPVQGMLSKQGTCGRGLFWKALTHRVPNDIADPIGAALACAWPDMHPNTVSLGRHFYPCIEHAVWQPALPSSAPRLDEHALEGQYNARLEAALATAGLYESPTAWIDAMVSSWDHQCALGGPDTTTLVLPSNLFD